MMKHHKKTNIFFIFYIVYFKLLTTQVTILITIWMATFSSTPVTFREKKRDHSLIWDESQKKV